MEKPTNQDSELRPTPGEPLDVSADFTRIVQHGSSETPFADFLEFMRSLKKDKVEFVKLRIDLSGETDKNAFIHKARFMKAFSEDGASKLDLSQYPGKLQRRQTIIRCTEKQKMWESNVFASGVEWEEAK